MQLIRLIWPVITVVLLSLLALVIVAGFLANQYDNDAESTQRTIIKSAIEKITHNLDVLAEDNSWWDDAVDNMVISENMDWINRTIGDVASSRNYVDGAIIMRPDHSILYHSGLDAELPKIDQWLDVGLRSAIANMEFVNGNVGVTKQGLLKHNNTLIAIGMSIIQPSGYKVYDPPLPATRRPVLILYQYLQEEEFKEIAEATGATEIQHSSHQPMGGYAALQLHDLNNNIIGYINWRQNTPGQKLLNDLFGPAVCLLFIVILASIYFMYQARTLIMNLEHANNAKMSFLASMSHEVRTPLNTIIGFAEVIDLEIYGKVGSEKNKEYVGIIRDSGQHLLSIVNDILDISKLEADRFEISTEEFDTQDTIKQCLRIIEVSATEKSIRIVPDLAEISIKSDERVMRQTLLNILSNAIKFTPKGGQVSVLSEYKRDAFVITVSDNGLGMSQEEIAIAREPFGQIHNESMTKATGTGLGLPIVDRFMKLVGGKLVIRSAPGHGTSVSLEFPAKPGN